MTQVGKRITEALAEAIEKVVTEQVEYRRSLDRDYIEELKRDKARLDKLEEYILSGGPDTVTELRLDGTCCDLRKDIDDLSIHRNDPTLKEQEDAQKA